PTFPLAWSYLYSQPVGFSVAQASSLVQEQARTLALRKTPKAGKIAPLAGGTHWVLLYQRATLGRCWKGIPCVQKEAQTGNRRSDADSLSGACAGRWAGGAAPLVARDADGADRRPAVRAR